MINTRLSKVSQSCQVLQNQEKQKKNEKILPILSKPPLSESNPARVFNGIDKKNENFEWLSNYLRPKRMSPDTNKGNENEKSQRNLVDILAKSNINRKVAQRNNRSQQSQREIIAENKENESGLANFQEKVRGVKKESLVRRKSERSHSQRNNHSFEPKYSHEVMVLTPNPLLPKVPLPTLLVNHEKNIKNFEKKIEKYEKKYEKKNAINMLSPWESTIVAENFYEIL